MNDKVPFYISATFIVLVLYLLFFILNSFNVALNKIKYTDDQRRKIFLQVPVVIFMWLIGISIIAYNGYFSDFSSFFPRIFIVILPPVLIIVLSVFSQSFKLLLFQIPPHKLINLQFFRVLLELMMVVLCINEVVPVQVTFLGSNFDILAGLSAPIVAWLAYRKERNNPKLALIWNLAGLALLVNKVIISILSTPVWFRYFENEPSNTFISYYPFIWIPGFVVPVAFFLHLASLRQAMMIEKWNTKKSLAI